METKERREAEVGSWPRNQTKPEVSRKSPELGAKEGRKARGRSLGKKQGCNWGNNEEKVQKKKKLGNEDRQHIGD